MDSAILISSWCPNVGLSGTRWLGIAQMTVGVLFSLSILNLGGFNCLRSHLNRLIHSFGVRLRFILVSGQVFEDQRVLEDARIVFRSTINVIILVFHDIGLQIFHFTLIAHIYSSCSQLASVLIASC